MRNPILNTQTHSDIEKTLKTCIDKIRNNEILSSDFVPKFMHLIAALDQGNMTEIVTYTDIASYMN